MPVSTASHAPAEGKGRLTDVLAEVHGLEDLDAKIRLNFTNDFDGVVESEMGVLLAGGTTSAL